MIILISADNVYNYLILFHDAYDQLPDIWKKKFFQSFIQEIQLYPEQQETKAFSENMFFGKKVVETMTLLKIVC